MPSVRYRWVEELDIPSLQKLCKAKILAFTQGWIQIGVSPEGEPIFKSGFEIEFEEEPTAKELAALTAYLRYLKLTEPEKI